MFNSSVSRLFAFLSILSCIAAACISSGDQTTINQALSAGGPGAIVQLCPTITILISDQITFTADNQELSTDSYPTDGERATIKIAPGSGVGTLVAGGSLSGIRLLNIQIDGDRPNTGWLKGSCVYQIPLGTSANILKVLERTSSWVDQVAALSSRTLPRGTHGDGAACT